MSQDRRATRVYVVDDESIISTTLGAILRMKGFEAHSFEFPQEALQAARELPPDLLITDVVMPLLSGIELAIQLREFSPSCKVLLFSGQAATSDLLEEAGASGFEFDVIAKPVHPIELLQKVDAILAQ